MSTSKKQEYTALLPIASAQRTLDNLSCIIFLLEEITWFSYNTPLLCLTFKEAPRRLFATFLFYSTSSPHRKKKSIGVSFFLQYQRIPQAASCVQLLSQRVTGLTSFADICFRALLWKMKVLATMQLLQKKLQYYFLIFVPKLLIFSV